MMKKTFASEDPKVSEALSAARELGLEPASIVWIPSRVMRPDRSMQCLLSLREEASPGIERMRVTVGAWLPGEGFVAYGPIRPVGEPVAWAYLPPPFDFQREEV
jgi:hypothetical protein